MKKNFKKIVIAAFIAMTVAGAAWAYPGACRECIFTILYVLYALYGFKYFSCISPIVLLIKPFQKIKLYHTQKYSTAY